MIHQVRDQKDIRERPRAMDISMLAPVLAQYDGSSLATQQWTRVTESKCVG